MIADQDIYSRLAAPFDEVFTDNRGGITLSYITGEQCISRLNEVLGVANWSFAVKEHGTNAEADEIWVLGRLEARIEGDWVVREQFGSQKLKRSRATSVPLDIGFDLKGAATDAQKKCAMTLGVGLYLSKKEAQPSNGHGQERTFTPAPKPNQQPPSTEAPKEWDETWICEWCGQQLQETKFKDGTSWTPDKLADFGRRKHSQVLCMAHYREANDRKRRAERYQEGAALDEAQQWQDRNSPRPDDDLPPF